MHTLTTLFKWLGLLMAGLMLLALASGLALAWALPPADAAVFAFGDQVMTVQQLGWPEWLALAAAFAMAGLVLALVAPLCMMGLALAFALPLAVVSGVGLLLAAPALLAAWLIWRRGGRAATRPQT